MNNFLINAIELKNIKSYQDERIEFGDGITIISGENGAGKSTIFEAVGHCLFGVAPSKFIGNADKFLSEGKKQGTVIVYFQITDTKNGNANNVQYRLEKNIKGETILQKKDEAGGWGPSIETGISERIEKLLDLSGPTSLDQMFTDIIGPFQSDFITPFQGSDTSRKNHFDQILGISGWKELNKRTSFLDNRFKDKISNLEFETTTLEKTIEPLPEKEEMLKKDTDRKKELESNLKVLNDKIEDIGKKIEEMTAIKTALDSKKTLETKISGEREGDKRLLETKYNDLEKAKKSLLIVNNARSGYEVHRENQKTKKNLEVQQKEKTEIFSEKARKENHITGTEQSIISSKNHYTEDKAKCEEESTGNIDQLKQKESELSLSTAEVDKARNLLEYRRGELEKIQSVDIGIISRKSDSVKSLLERMSSLEKSIANRREALREKESLQKESEKLTELERELSSINDRISTEKAKITQYKKGKEDLSQGLCPYMGAKCLNLGAWNTDEFFNKKIEESQIQTKELEVVKKAQENLKKIALSAGQKLAGLAKEEKELQKELGDLEHIGDEIRSSITKDELEDLFRQMEIYTLSFEDKRVRDSLIILGKKLADFNLPDELDQYPSVLDTAFRFFMECRESVILTVKDWENQAAADLELKVHSKSSLETQVKKLKSDESKLSKQLKKILGNLVELDKKEKLLEEEKKQLVLLENKLKTFEGLEDKLLKVEEKLTESSEDHNLYMSNLKDSQQVDVLLKSTEELRKSIQNRDDSLSKLKEEIAALSEKFNQEELDNVRSDFSNLKEKLGEDRKELQNTIKEMKSLEKEISSMKETKEIIKKRKTEIVEYRKSQEFSAFLRKSIIAKIADEIAQDYRREISAIANKIYREISGGKYLEELKWGDSYSIILKDVGENNKVRKRTDKQLSGGQFMTAVIAIRMALLEIIGSTIAFFDEPTGNLDEERRRNLADVFRRLDQKTNDRWFSQLFLVSHDESFEGITKHHIRIRLDKEYGSKLDSDILPEMGMKHARVTADLE